MSHIYSEFKKRHKEHEEELEERAAIIQYHGKRDQKTAENMAMLRIKDKYNLWGKND